MSCDVAVDEEQALTLIRAYEYREQFEFCDWASMTVWLRAPVDFSSLPLGRQYLHEDAWTDRAIKMPPASAQRALKLNPFLYSYAPPRAYRSSTSSSVRRTRK